MALLGACCSVAVASPALAWPTHLSQGQLVVLATEPGAAVELAGRRLRVSPQGVFTFGVGRDQPAALELRWRLPNSEWRSHAFVVRPRAWPIEQVTGVPPATVEPAPELAARIAREQAAVAAARRSDRPASDFAAGFQWPLDGRISGRFGSERRYNGKPGTPHSGTDIAAAEGTPVRAPAAATVGFAAADLFLTGGTLLLDHGHGVSSVFLHLSRIDVAVGDRVEAGAIVGAVGATGRASGPHLHWGLNWFEVRLDPEWLFEHGSMQ